MSLPPRPGAIGLVFQQEGMLNVGLDYDCVDEYIYWTEVIEGCVMRAKYDGSGREVVFERSQVRSPEGTCLVFPFVSFPFPFLPFVFFLPFLSFPFPSLPFPSLIQ